MKIVVKIFKITINELVWLFLPFLSYSQHGINSMLVVTQTSFKSQSIFETILSVSKNEICIGTFFHVPISQQQKVTCSNSTIEALEKVWNMLTLKAVFSSVSIVDFEQVNVWWVLILIILVIIRLHKWCKGWKFRFDIKITQQVGYLNAKKEVNHFR